MIGYFVFYIIGSLAGTFDNHQAIAKFVLGFIIISKCSTSIRVQIQTDRTIFEPEDFIKKIFSENKPSRK